MTISERFLDPDHPDAQRLLTGFVNEMATEIGFDPTRSVSAAPDEMRPPHGAFLVLDLDGVAVACGGLKRHADRVGEIKRMYVDPPARGRRLGAMLLECLERRARALGYVRLVLDTSSLEAPNALYLRAGYLRVPPFNDNPYATRWYEKSLVALESEPLDEVHALPSRLDRS